MARPLPGTVEVEGREFMYLQYPKGRGFPDLICDLMAACPEVPTPQSGGILEEKARINLPDNTSLLAVSFKGDLIGWRNKIVAYCDNSGSKWAVLRKQVLVISDGSEMPLIDCEIEFDA